MNNNENLSFSSLEEKCQYYIKEYNAYKSKYISLNKEYENLLENNKKLYENINTERKLRKEIEEKLKYSNFTNNINVTNINNDKNEKVNISQDEFEILEKDIDEGEEELLNLKRDIKSKKIEIINIINFSILSKRNIENIIIEKDDQISDENKVNINNDGGKNEEQTQKKIIYNNKLKDAQSNKEIINEEKLTTDFIIYSKESIFLSNSINENELKLDKIYSYINKFCHFLKVLKKGANFFKKSIELFSNNLSTYHTDNKSIFEAWPSLREYVDFIQKSFSTINIYCSSLISTIDSSCLIQINNIIIPEFKKLENIRNNTKNKKEEFKAFKKEFLANKNYESLKNKYYKEYEEYEISKYNYFSSFNKLTILIKLKFPEVMSLLVYSYFVYFNGVKNEFNHIHDIIKIRLQRIIDAMKIKNKIESDMEVNQKKILENIETYNKTKNEKEGFLFLKEKEGTRFSKRYVKISNGNLIYYKIKKGYKQNFENLDNKIFTNLIDYVDTQTSFNICNLLFSNVKKCSKNNYYPFCFEVNVANTKEAYIFQADTEYEMEEWISAITNSISGQISNFNEEQIDNKKKADDNNIIIYDEEKKALLERSKILIKNLIDVNKCADCGADNPTWLDINWLVLLCMDCSGIHRSLGVQISKIKSLELDNIDSEYIDLLYLIRPNDLNKIFEEKLNQIEKKPRYNSLREEKEKFIINKYKEKKYINIPNEKNENDIIKNIFDNIKINNLLNVFRLIKFNKIDINKIYSYEGEEYGFIHYSTKLGFLFHIELFHIFGGNINLKDKKGLKPIDYVSFGEQQKIYDYLKSREK